MITFEASGKKEFYRMFMRLQSLKYNFNSREIAIAAEFLFFRDYYTTKPIFDISYEEIDGELTEVKEKMNIFDQVKDKRTIQVVMKTLDMSITVLRKHVQGLKDKGFFTQGDIAKEFLTDGVSVSFNLLKK